MKRMLAIGCMLSWLLAASTAFSQQGPQGPHGRRGERMGPPPGRPVPARDMGPAGHPGRPPMERMTPEDRRQLRHDIHQHGRDVYRGRPAADKQ